MPLQRRPWQPTSAEQSLQIRVEAGKPTTATTATRTPGTTRTRLGDPIQTGTGAATTCTTTATDATTEPTHDTNQLGRPCESTYPPMGGPNADSAANLPTTPIQPQTTLEAPDAAAAAPSGEQTDQSTSTPQAAADDTTAATRNNQASSSSSSQHRPRTPTDGETPGQAQQPTQQTTPDEMPPWEAQLIQEWVDAQIDDPVRYMEIPPDAPINSHTHGDMRPMTHGCWHIEIVPAPGNPPSTAAPPQRTPSNSATGCRRNSQRCSTTYHRRTGDLRSTSMQCRLVIKYAPPPGAHEPGTMLLTAGDKLRFELVETEWIIRMEYLNPDCPEDVQRLRDAGTRPPAADANRANSRANVCRPSAKSGASSSHEGPRSYYTHQCASPSKQPPTQGTAQPTLPRPHLHYSTRSHRHRPSSRDQPSWMTDTYAADRATKLAKHQQQNDKLIVRTTADRGTPRLQPNYEMAGHWPQEAAQRHDGP